MTPELQLDTLRLLVAVADGGSIGAAARSAGISQPAASKRIREFEARWRLNVLARSTRGAKLTVDGEAVVTWARRVLHEVDLMRAGLGALTSERRASLSIAASLTIAEFLLPRWIGELRATAPELQPHLRVVNSDQVAELVRDGAVDVGFIETARLPEDLSVTNLGTDSMVLVVHPDHPWARRSTPLTHSMLAAAEYVLREEGSGTLSTFQRALRLKPRVALEAGSTAALLGAVLAGVGPAVVSARAVVDYQETGRLVVVPHVLDLRRPLSAIRRPDARFDDQSDRLVRLAQLAIRRETGSAST